VRPTVDTVAKPILEVCVFDFDRDLYGQRITVTFLQKLRDEQKFDGLAALTAQMRLDADVAREFVARHARLPEAA
jgi:riboflavin kinase/FMN adenylyltransferase